ncbi:MAG: magnesium transporter CorA family protein [Actinomycetota bacterium]
MLVAICHTDATGWTDVRDLEQISGLIDAGQLVWAQADVASLSPSDVSTIQGEFGLHPLAVEDAINLKQRPKLEAYENHLFAVAHQLDSVEGQLEASQIACFVGRHYVLTLHEGASRILDEAASRLRRTPKPVERGPSFVMHALLDTVVDDYQAIADTLEEEVEELEDKLLKDPTAAADRQIYTLKQQLARLRRYAQPGGRVLASFVDSNQTTVATNETAAYFRDVLDHTLRITDQLRNVEELVDALLELRRMEQTNQMTDVTKRLTGWAAVIAVPTFIASVYGMNFTLTPNNEGLGFEIALGLMAASAIALYTFFKKRDWI